MIAPDKYTSIDSSLIGVGAAMLKMLHPSMTITALWEACRGMPSIGTFNRFVLALDLLYILGTIELRGGIITRTLP